MKLADSIALVTGAGRGIGRAIALAYAREGANVAVATLEPDEASAVAEEIRQLGGSALAVPVDVSQEQQVQQMVELTLAEFGRIDLLVNNAGTIVLPGDILGTTPDAWDRMMAVNVRSVYLCCRAVLPGMMDRREGRIINIASGCGLHGAPNRVAYGASKHAVVGLTRCLAIDVKPYGIAVNGICPAAVDTALTAYFRPDAEKTNWMQPPDVADVALFLASAESRAMTGALVEVAGWGD